MDSLRSPVSIHKSCQQEMTTRIGMHAWSGGGDAVVMVHSNMGDSHPVQ